MKLIDRYIVFEFFRVFAICFITFLGLFVVADFVNNFDELARYGDTHGGLGRVTLSFYGPRIPWFFDLISRVVSLVASIFAITSLQRHNEMAAIMAAGVSRWRIVKPLVISAGVVAVLAALNRELIIPRLRDEITRDAKNYAGDQAEQVRARYDHETDIFFDGEGIRLGSEEIDEPRLHLPTTLAPRGTRLKARRAKYFPAWKDREAGFLLMGVDEDSRGRTTIYDGNKPVVFGPADTDWLRADQLFVPTRMPFEHLRSGNHWRRYASTLSLISGARNPSLDYGPDVSVTIHLRLLRPVLDMTLLFLGLPIVLSKESQNAFIAIGSCMLAVTLFVVTSLVFQSMGMNYLIRPSLSAWAPLLIFIPAAVLMSEPLRR